MSRTRFFSLIAATVLSASLSEAPAQVLGNPMIGLPPIADGQIFAADWMKWPQGSARFTAVLNRDYPPGSDEDKLEAVLATQGFKVPDYLEKTCGPTSIGSMPTGNDVPPQCKAFIGKHVMAYRWKPMEQGLASLICEQSLSVTWSAKDKKILEIEGSYRGNCV